MKIDKKMKNMRANGKIVVSFPDADAAKSAEASLGSETGFSRARMESKANGKSLQITIDADDIVAFRAAANGALRNLQVFESIEDNDSEVH